MDWGLDFMVCKPFFDFKVSNKLYYLYKFLFIQIIYYYKLAGNIQEFDKVF